MVGSTPLVKGESCGWEHPAGEGGVKGMAPDKGW